MEIEETDVERAKRIEYFKSKLGSHEREIYDLAKSFWKTEEGKKAIRDARRRL